MEMKTNNWSLYVDDVRNPKDSRNWKIARTAEEAKNLIRQNGFPEYISFDHDLGMKEIRPGVFSESNEETGYDLAKWIVESDMNGEINITPDFSFNVHSANTFIFFTVGAKADDNRLQFLLKEVQGKDITELIASGRGSWLLY